MENLIDLKSQKKDDGERRTQTNRFYMKKLTEVTRQNLYEIITSGFYVKELIDPTVDCDFDLGKKKFKIYMYRYGRLSEIDFLGRLYDLSNLPSYDRRYASALGDIHQHTVSNNDWEEDWVFNDDRFKLGSGNEDEPLLKFICKMLDPVVLRNDSPYLEYVKKFNEILNIDGYELYTEENVSGREIYNFRETNCIEIKTPKGKNSYNLSFIGEGSYANVFKYKDEFYNRFFVLKRAKKELDSKELKRFKLEFEEMNRLKSPYVVEVYSYDDETHEYIMEYMDCSLKKFIDKNNSEITKQQRYNIIMQLFRAYNYIHSKGVFHRDISPNNVLLRKYDDTVVAKIADFGLVKVEESDLTSTDTDVKGSFNDPALKVDGFKNYNLLHEIYAFTLLCVYICTGKTNFSTVRETKLIEFMKKGTHADTAQRFQNLEEMKNAIVEYFKGK